MQPSSLQWSFERVKNQFISCAIFDHYRKFPKNNRILLPVWTINHLSHTSLRTYALEGAFFVRKKLHLFWRIAPEAPHLMRKRVIPLREFNASAHIFLFLHSVKRSIPLKTKKGNDPYRRVDWVSEVRAQPFFPIRATHPLVWILINSLRSFCFGCAKRNRTQYVRDLISEFLESEFQSLQPLMNTTYVCDRRFCWCDKLHFPPNGPWFHVMSWSTNTHTPFRWYGCSSTVRKSSIKIPFLIIVAHLDRD